MPTVGWTDRNLLFWRSHELNAPRVKLALDWLLVRMLVSIFSKSSSECFGVEEANPLLESSSLWSQFDVGIEDA